LHRKITFVALNDAARWRRIISRSEQRLITVIITVDIGIPLEFVNESFPRPRRVNARPSIDPDEQTDTCEREVGIHVSLDNHQIERGKSIITLGLRSVKLIWSCRWPQQEFSHPCMKCNGGNRCRYGKWIIRCNVSGKLVERNASQL